MIVGNQYFAIHINAHAYWVIGDALAANLSHILTLIIEDFDAVSSIVTNENFLTIMRTATPIGKL